MRLYRVGDEGEAVRDIQSRLSAVGIGTEPDPVGMFGDGTRRAVTEFQGRRGLTGDGIVGNQTWQALVDAGFALGDRMLYHRVPMMRGDDVAELQRRLNSLGFDAGKVDGVFGADTLRSLLDFQSNRRMPEDGIVGRDVVAELDLMARATQKHGRESVRERQWLATLPRHLVGQRIYVDAYCRDDTEAASCWDAAVEFATTIQNLGGHPLLSRSVDTTPPEETRARRANRLGADFVVAFALPGDNESAVLYFSSQHSQSAAGETVAAAVAGSLGIGSVGRSTVMLRETRPPAIVVAAEPMDADLGRAVAGAIKELFATGTRDGDSVPST